MAPILPGLTDAPEALARVVRAARDAGATGIWAEFAYLQPGTREHFLAEAERSWPGERARLEALYHERAYLVRERRAALRAGIEALRREHPRRPLAREPIVPQERPVLAQQLGLAL